MQQIDMVKIDLIIVGNSGERDTAIIFVIASSFLQNLSLISSLYPFRSWKDMPHQEISLQWRGRYAKKKMNVLTISTMVINLVTNDLALFPNEQVAAFRWSKIQLSVWICFLKQSQSTSKISRLTYGTQLDKTNTFHSPAGYFKKPMAYCSHSIWQI